MKMLNIMIFFLIAVLLLGCASLRVIPDAPMDKVYIRPANAEMPESKMIRVYEGHSDDYTIVTVDGIRVASPGIRGGMVFRGCFVVPGTHSVEYLYVTGSRTEGSFQHEIIYTDFARATTTVIVDETECGKKIRQDDFITLLGYK
jgi:hypothetical protein